MWYHAQTQIYHIGLGSPSELPFLCVRAPASTKGCLEDLGELRVYYIQVHIDFVYVSEETFSKQMR